jgi:hypothetical protein
LQRLLAAFPEGDYPASRGRPGHYQHSLSGNPCSAFFDNAPGQWQTYCVMYETAPKRRGFPVGTPRNRLTPQQRQAIIDMLRVTPNGAAVTRQFLAAKLGTVTHPTVCTIKRDAIKRGVIQQQRKATPA